MLSSLTTAGLSTQREKRAHLMLLTLRTAFCGGWDGVYGQATLRHTECNRLIVDACFGLPVRCGARPRHEVNQESLMRSAIVAVCLWVWIGATASAEVVKVTVTSRAPVADGQSFGTTGPYEKLAGTIEFALDPKHPRNRAIVDLDRATLAADGKLHFTADLYVLQPATPARGNGALLFEISNRGTKGLLARFNRAAVSADPVSAADLGDGFLMREGYTLVWVGWQFDVAPPGLRIEAPEADVTGRTKVSFVPDEDAQTEYTIGNFPDLRQPVDPAAPPPRSPCATSSGGSRRRCLVPHGASVRRRRTAGRA